MKFSYVQMLPVLPLCGCCSDPSMAIADSMSHRALRSTDVPTVSYAPDDDSVSMRTVLQCLWFLAWAKPQDLFSLYGLNGKTLYELFDIDEFFTWVSSMETVYKENANKEIFAVFEELFDENAIAKALDLRKHENLDDKAAHLVETFQSAQFEKWAERRLTPEDILTLLHDETEASSETTRIKQSYRNWIERPILTSRQRKKDP
ncbi:unnamed protein product [Peronospora belbahrii]|uniref:Uncharacterized protein n=2 Tax=Peronospora belbahrii TaxID=622444 RepID=A0AAU9KW70_9STRA|nr:unnamed protein product [Peronospora belbahrii]